VGEFYGNQHTTVEEWEYDDLKAAVEAYAAEHGAPPTTDEAAADDRFPSLSTIYRYLDGSWNDLLADAGLERGHVGSYGPGEREAMLADMRAVLESVDAERLTTRAYAADGAYSDDTIKATFGSWRTACERAGVEPGRKYGVGCEGPSGASLDSRRELQVARFLHERGVEYVVHPAVPESDWLGDFHLPAFGRWVESTGSQRASGRTRRRSSGSSSTTSAWAWSASWSRRRRSWRPNSASSHPRRSDVALPSCTSGTLKRQYRLHRGRGPLA